LAKEENRQLRDQVERLAARLDALEDDKPKRHRRTIDEAA
jgi:hypothetical protein